MENNWKNKIETSIKNNDIMIYIRGTPDAPRCGFTAKVIRSLKDLNHPYSYEDMDQNVNPGLWDALKEMNNWPTSPQIFIKGEFIGGCDIFVEMLKSGDIQKMLK